MCVTLGSHGAQWGDTTVPAPAITLVNTTGARDAFAGIRAQRKMANLSLR